MSQDDDLLDEIFHETRKQLKTRKGEKNYGEDRACNNYGSRQSLDLTANDTWRTTGDSFQFACRRIQTRAVEIENRLQKVTPADILASLRVFAKTSCIKHPRPEENIEGRDFSNLREAQRKDRVLASGDDKGADSNPQDDDCMESLLEIIRQWVDPTQERKRYPDLEGDNKILSAYWDAIRVVGQGRDNVEPTLYNNPFDPRLRFDGLAHLVWPRFDGRHVVDKPQHNVLLTLDKVSDIVDECFSKYNVFLRALSRKSQILSCHVGGLTSTNQSAMPNDALSTNSTGSRSSNDEAGDVSFDEIKLLENIRAVRGIWDECSIQPTVSQIPRRITARKPHSAPKWRSTVKSEINTSAWPDTPDHDDGKRAHDSLDPQIRRILRRKEREVICQEDAGTVHGRNETLQGWQRFAQEHIDEDALKHLKNATKERPGIKIMQPSLTSRCDTSLANTYASRVARSGISTSSNNVCRNNSNLSTTALCQTVSYASGNTDGSVPTSDISKNFHIYPAHTTTGNTGESHYKTIEMLQTNAPQSSSGAIEQVPTECRNIVKSVNISSVKTDDQNKIAKSTDILETSDLNPLNSSPEWLRKLIAKTVVKSMVTKVSKVRGVDVKLTDTSTSSNTTTNLAQCLKVPFVSSTPYSESTLVTLDAESIKTSTVVPQVPRPGCRVPPGFENAAEIKAKTQYCQGSSVSVHPTPPQQHRTVHVPQTQQWQKTAGTVYAGASGEAYIQQHGYQANAPRVLQGFQRPVTQIGGNIAIWHPQPHQGNYMLTDVHGKTVGVGVPAAAWSRLDLPPRPHVVVHQQQIPPAPHAATFRQGAIFAQTASYAVATDTDSYSGQHQQQQGQMNLAEAQGGSNSGPGTANSYERGDTFVGYGCTATQPPPHHLGYQARVVPQFLPPVPSGPPMVQEYALFAPNQHKQQLYNQQQNLNQNNSNLSSAEMDSLFGSTRRPDVRLRTVKVPRAIRSNLIQLA